ncbi:MAG: hypothetical protein AB7G28_26725 [Pirellulales bacterium]
MFVAVPFLMLVALVGLGSLTAIVFGIVYAIANKRPAVAVGSLLVPVLGFFAVLVGMTFIGVWQGYINGPVNVSWNEHADAAGVPPVPAMPSMPKMPPMPPIGKMVDAPTFVVSASKLAIIGIIALVLVGIFRKRSACSGRPRRGMNMAVMAAMAVAVFAAIQSSRHSSHRSSFAWNQAQENAVQAELAVDEQSRRDADAAREKIAKAEQKANDAKEKAAVALFEGKSFQEMFDRLNRPRIQLDPEGATVTIGETANPADAAGRGGPTKIVVPMSAETQESLARSAARLEQLVEQVSEAADQVSDTGTLLGKAMIALNDRIDARSKAKAATPAPAAPAEATGVENPVQVSVPPALQVKEVAITAVTSGPVHTDLDVKRDEIDLGNSGKQSIVVKIDRQLLAQTGLSFEQLKESLSDEGLWNGTVVRFDENKLQITATGHFADDYLPRLKNTFLSAKGLHGKSVHLSDLAEVEMVGAVVDKPREQQARPAWVDLPPQQVGNIQRGVVATEEYSSREECARAADVLLLYKTYEHLLQLLGNPRSEEPLPSVAFRSETGKITADGKVVYQSHGQYGVWLDPQLAALAKMGIGIDFVRREMVPADGEYYEKTERSAGVMNKLYTQLEFRSNVDQELLRRWDEMRRSERFAVVGAGAGSVLGLVGLALGLLKVDTWTKGYYSKRLFLGVPAAIIGGLALLFAAT